MARQNFDDPEEESKNDIFVGPKPIVDFSKLQPTEVTYNKHNSILPYIEQIKPNHAQMSAHNLQPSQE